MKVSVDGVSINYHDAGTGEPVILLHGSGPGVSAAENWSRTLDVLADRGFRAIAPDVVGFGDSDRPEGFQYDARGWAESIRGFMSALDLGSAHLVGNSMGGRIALTLAGATPHLVRSLTLMGVRAPSVPPAAGLGKVRGYEPSLENMRSLLTDYFVVDPAVVTDEVVTRRYEASTRPGEHEHYRRMFSYPGANDLPLSDDDLRSLAVRTLIVHGREDKVIPVDHTYAMAALIPDVVSVVVSGCGHWVQVEQADMFESQLTAFLRGYGDAGESARARQSAGTV
ncbi:alpha/beta fold hydrolase [Micromonospora inositola]|nr:alpha/beta hydrolase [Micromonospora inositola]